MISNQLALKPFMTRLAQREGMSYSEMLTTQANGLKDVPEDQFVNDPQVKGSGDFARSLNLKASDLAEVRGDLAKVGLNARVSEGMINMMAVTAMAMEPGVAVGLDGAMRLVALGEKPLDNSAVKDGKLDLQPALEHMATEMKTDVASMLKEAAAEAKTAKPEDVAAPRIDDLIKTASVFPVTAGSLEKLADTFKQEGLSDRQTDAMVSTLVLGAIGYEPTFRPGLNQIFGVLMQQQEPMKESALEAVA